LWIECYSAFTDCNVHRNEQKRISVLVLVKVIECVEQAGGGVVSVDPAVMLSDVDRERCESTQTDKLGFVDLNSKYRILSLFQNEADPVPRFTLIKTKIL